MTDPTRRWQIRPVRAGDEPGIATLFQRTFRREQSPARYRWKVLERGAEGLECGWIAVDGSRPVGHYGGTLLRFKLGETVVPVVHSVDAMTDPDYRRQGILTAIVARAHANWRDHGVPFVTGLPAGKWGSRRDHLGWQPLFSAPWSWRPLDPAALLTRRGVPRALARAAHPPGALWNRLGNHRLTRESGDRHVTPVTHPGDALDQLWARVGAAYDALVVRDREWLAYRYLGAPAHDYHLLLAHDAAGPAGFLAYRLTGAPSHRSGWIMDLFAAPPDEATRAALLRTAVERMAAAGAQSVRMLLPGRTPAQSVLRRGLFIRARGAYDISVTSLREGSLPPLLQSPATYYTQLGDYDAL